jgi:hypothetical protein
MTRNDGQASVGREEVSSIVADGSEYPWSDLELAVCQFLLGWHNRPHGMGGGGIELRIASKGTSAALTSKIATNGFRVLRIVIPAGPRLERGIVIFLQKCVTKKDRCARYALNSVPGRAGTVLGAWSIPTALSVLSLARFDEGAFCFAYPVQRGLIIIISEKMQFTDHTFIERRHFEHNLLSLLERALKVWNGQLRPPCESGRIAHGFAVKMCKPLVSAFSDGIENGLEAYDTLHRARYGITDPPTVLSLKLASFIRSALFHFSYLIPAWFLGRDLHIPRFSQAAEIKPQKSDLPFTVRYGPSTPTLGAPTP